MGISQRSFEVLFGRFQDGDTYIQSLTIFDPTKAIIKKANLTLFIADVILKDKAVNLALQAYRDAVAERKALSFKYPKCDTNCLENRIRNIHSFIGSDISKDKAAYKLIGGFIKKIAPVYKKDPLLPKGSGKSPSEKSYVALNGYGTQTSELINDLGIAYAPTNTYIEAAAFGTFVNDMIARAKLVSKLEGNHSDAVKIRYEIYHGKDGLLERQATIKEYLASFPEGKNSQNYIEFNRLIKGN